MKIIEIISDWKRLLNYISIFIVFLNFTNTYLFISGISGLAFQHVSLLMMSAFVLNICANFKTLHDLIIRRKILILFLLIFCVLPMLGVFLSPYVMMRFVGYYVLSALIFINVILFIKKEGFAIFKRYLFYSYLWTLFGILLSYLAPNLFYTISQMQAQAMGMNSVWGEIKVGEASHARAFGFYMQPNKAYTAVLFHLFILVTAFFNKNLYGRLFLYISAFGAILLTGSRGGFLMFFIFVLLVLLSEILHGGRNKFNRKVSFTSFIPAYFSLFIGLNIVAVTLMIFGKSSFLGEGLNVVQKIIQTFSTAQSQGILSDASVFYRIKAQSEYLSFIFQDPFKMIIGYGVGASDYYKYFGDLSNSSHNNFLEVVFEHGLPLGLIMYGFLIYLAFTRESKQFLAYYSYNISSLIVICFIIQSFTINTLFTFRLFPLLVGFWLMSLYFPEYKNRRL